MVEAAAPSMADFDSAREDLQDYACLTINERPYTAVKRTFVGM